MRNENKKHNMITFETEAFYRKEECIAPHEYLQHWEIAKTTKKIKTW